MKKYDIVFRAPGGELMATCEAEENVPTSLILQAVMWHQQLRPVFDKLQANQANTILITSESRLTVPKGLTVFLDKAQGVSINGPLLPSPVPNVPRQFDGVQLTHNLSVAVVYSEPQVPPATEFEDADTEDWTDRIASGSMAV